LVDVAALPKMQKEKQERNHGIFTFFFRSIQTSSLRCNLTDSMLFPFWAIILAKTPPETPCMVLDKYQKKLCMYTYYYYL
jgi:hypothetical protein